MVMLAGLWVGCDGNLDSPGDGEQGSPVACEEDDRAAPYAPGMQAVARDGVSEIRLMEADPTPPEKGDNAWTLEVVDMLGQGVADLDIAVKLFMPDHGHGSPVAAEASAQETAGRYTVAPLHFNMGGLWEVTLDLADAAGQPVDQGVFRVCIDD